MSSATLPARTEPRPASIPIDRAAVLQALGINPRDPNAQALLLTCERYGLDPILKHMMLIKGQLYVTRDGLLHVAHRSGQFDGMEVLAQGETPTHYTARVSVFRKDMSRPFTYIGRYPKAGQNKAYGPEMAVKCAEVMSLRRAFDVALCAREEVWDRDLEEEREQPDDHQARRPQSVPARSGKMGRPADRPPRIPPDDWDTWITGRVERENVEFHNHQVFEGKPRSEVKDLTNVYRAMNYLATRLVECHAIAESDLLNGQGKRDKDKARRAVAGQYLEAPEWCREVIESHLMDCWARGCAALGLPNPHGPQEDPGAQAAAEDERQDAPAEVAVGGREPGDDG